MIYPINQEINMKEASISGIEILLSLLFTIPMLKIRPRLQMWAKQPLEAETDVDHQMTKEILNVLKCVQHYAQRKFIT